MKLSATLLCGGALLSGFAAAAPTVSYVSGFNIGANRANDNGCKTIADWKVDLQKIKQWGTPNNAKAKFNAIKIFSSGSCYSLQNAVQAAEQVGGIKIWAGIWNSPDKFGADKAALEKMIKWKGSSWLAGVIVGSESLYRKEITANALAGQIHDVKGMVHVALKAPNVPVGTADTWTSWVDVASNKPVIDACDVVIMNGFPYWQGKTINQGLDALKKAIWDTRKAVGYEKPFVLGETGWPTAGPNFQAATANLENLRAYWKDTVCWLVQRDYPWFWFSAFDEPNKADTIEKNFGAAWSGRTAKVEMNIQKLCSA